MGEINYSSGDFFPGYCVSFISIYFLLYSKVIYILKNYSTYLHTALFNVLINSHWLLWPFHKKRFLLFEVLFPPQLVFFSFLFNTFIYFIYFIFGCFGSLLLLRGLSLVAASGGYSSLQCAGFSLQWLLLLQSTDSRRVGFSSCDMRPQ